MPPGPCAQRTGFVVVPRPLRGNRTPWFGSTGGLPRVSRSLLFDSYIEHANRQGVKRRSIETAIGIFIRKIVPKGFRSFNGFYEEEVNFVGSSEAGLIYVFPPLVECRKFFEDKIQQTIEWATDRNSAGEPLNHPLVDWLKGSQVYTDRVVDCEPAPDLPRMKPDNEPPPF